ncbi:hypothetical protein, partial [Eikenella corrodens]|uniref:hypothetical protein n=1 Tax=Eikenella corrodens TaxID=539 RepID=UPI0028EA160A
TARAANRSIPMPFSQRSAIGNMLTTFQLHLPPFRPLHRQRHTILPPYLPKQHLNPFSLCNPALHCPFLLFRLRIEATA